MGSALLIAALGAFEEFNHFLCTAPGQKFALDTESAFTALMSHFGVHLAPLPDAVAAAKASDASTQNNPIPHP